mmetsp:Transcript_32895/g.47607  ORF Transcript_32895/g.47607 Transcript_32895/m.47607 type:complete len:87 (-) Transcript_32895:71-331(-)
MRIENNYELAPKLILPQYRHYQSTTSITSNGQLLRSSDVSIMLFHDFVVSGCHRRVNTYQVILIMHLRNHLWKMRAKQAKAVRSRR